jgi:hypothetical protein
VNLAGRAVCREVFPRRRKIVAVGYTRPGASVIIPPGSNPSPRVECHHHRPRHHALAGIDLGKEDCTMKLSMLFTTLICVLAVFTPAFGDDVAQPEAFYQAAIDQEIASCMIKRDLRDSRSLALRREAHLAASKARFLEANRDYLVQAMLEQDLACKDYKIAQFLNEPFFSTTYATLAPSGQL